ncbi:MAG TPA: NUDIX domain-containing protein [Longimicrobium sp.]|nr:NUDIX domain-containing protein [Longimicrobium sp.]
MEIRLHDAVGEDEDVPEWALHYNAKEYPRHAVTGDAVALALDEGGAAPGLDALVVTRAKDPFAGLDAWPGGFLDWVEDDDTHQAAVRELREETGMAPPEYVEPLGSYSRNGRDPRQFAGYRTKGGEWVARGTRVTSNAYLMLMRKDAGRAPAAADDASGARWASVYAYLPWEDLRAAAGRDAARAALDALRAWADASEDAGDRRERIDYAWGFGLKEWNEERVPERWALLVEAALVPEGRRDRWGRSGGGDDRHGREMAFDHRQVLADALGRLRGKIKYLPAALVALAGDELTLDELQAACEAIAGRPLHRANFRRTVAPPAGEGRQPRTPRIVAGTGRRKRRGAGEPGVAPELFRFRPDAVRARLDTSLRLPWLPVPSA